MVERSKVQAKWDGVTVPTTLEEYCRASSQQHDMALSKRREQHDMTVAILLGGDEDDYCFCGGDDEEDDPEELGDIYEEAKPGEYEDEGVAFGDPTTPTSGSAKNPPNCGKKDTSNAPSTSSNFIPI